MFFIVGLRNAEIMSLSTGRSLLRPGDERIISAVQGPQKKTLFVSLFSYHPPWLIEGTGYETRQNFVVGICCRDLSKTQ